MAVTAKLDLRDNPIFIFPKVPIMKNNFSYRLLLGTIAAFSQLNFENLSFAAALERSSKTGKLIFFNLSLMNACNVMKWLIKLLKTKIK